MNAGSFADLVAAGYDLCRDTSTWLQSVREAALPIFPNVGFGLIALTYDATPDTTSRVREVAVGTDVRPASAFHEAVAQTLSLGPPGPVCGALGERLTLKDERTTAMAELHRLEPRATDLMVAANVDHGGLGIALISLSASPLPPLSRSAQARWTRTLVHLATALRLRDRLDASAESAQQGLRRLVLEKDRVPCRSRGCDPPQARELWQGLIEGRLSLVHRFESDGCCYFVTRRNAEAADDPRALSKRECEVIVHTSRGLSDKQIAYRLDLCRSTVTTHLNCAMRKLGVSSRTELLRMLDAFGS